MREQETWQHRLHTVSERASVRGARERDGSRDGTRFLGLLSCPQAGEFGGEKHYGNNIRTCSADRLGLVEPHKRAKEVKELDV